MFAVFESGSKQYIVEEGDVVDVELLNEEKEVAFHSVLLLCDGEKITIGAPHLPKCVIKAEVMEIAKGPKTIAFKYKKRKSSCRTVGHRQKYSRVKITKINIG